MGKLKKLINLNASDNNLKALPKTIHKATDLESCVVSNNKIKKLPKNIGAAPNLTDLNCSNNSLKSLPKSIYRLQKSLDASGNQIDALPNIVITKKSKGNISQINLSNNRLSTLPEDINKLQRLTDINVQNNDLEYLPSGNYLLMFCFYLFFLNR